MKRLLLALVAAGFASATLGALAADEKPYTGQPKIEKPGRAADDSAAPPVKAGGATDKPGRTADEGAPAGKTKHKKKKKKEPAQ